MTETIKHLVLKEATLEEALQIIGHEWGAAPPWRIVACCHLRLRST
jgi:hypothetical protein